MRIHLRSLLALNGIARQLKLTHRHGSSTALHIISDIIIDVYNVHVSLRDNHFLDAPTIIPAAHDNMLPSYDLS